MMTRSFLAFDLDPATLDSAARIAAAVAEHTPGRARWVRREVMHVTLRFLGDVADERLAAVARLVRELCAGRSAIAVRARGLGAFPAPRKARVLVVPLDDDGAMAEISSAAETGLVALGFAPEERPFRPHLTLARFREPADVRGVVAREDAQLDGRAVAVTLYASELGPDGPRYRVLERVDLVGGSGDQV